MNDLEEARRRWIEERSRFEAFGHELKRALQRSIQNSGTWANASSRAKAMDSLIRKLINKSHHTYASLPDKAGLRIVVLYKDHINTILDLARDLFDVSEEENTADRLKPDVFGYLGVHAAIRYRPDDPKAADYPPDTFSAELQIRTLSQDLWAEMSHNLMYKNNEALAPLSDQTKRRIYILAGVVELADEEFSRIAGEMPDMPELSVLKHLEAHLSKLTTRRPHYDISLEIIQLLSPLYKTDARQIISHLDQFYAEQEGFLRKLYAESEDLPNQSAFLHQPEALMLYDRLRTNQLAVRKVWCDKFPEKELERIANTFGISFD